MQIVANCILRHENKVVLLQKPRRGWWVAPGGKVEPGETPLEAVKREFREETGILLMNPELRGVFTVNVMDGEQLLESWILLTFYAQRFRGTLLPESEEGILRWTALEEMKRLPMAEGDRFFFDHILRENSVLTGKFLYTADYELIDWRPDEIVLPCS